MNNKKRLHLLLLYFNNVGITRMITVSHGLLMELIKYDGHLHAHDSTNQLNFHKL